MAVIEDEDVDGVRRCSLASIELDVAEKLPSLPHVAAVVLAASTLIAPLWCSSSPLPPLPLPLPATLREVRCAVGECCGRAAWAAASAAASADRASLALLLMPLPAVAGPRCALVATPYVASVMYTSERVGGEPWLMGLTPLPPPAPAMPPTDGGLDSTPSVEPELGREAAGDMPSVDKPTARRGGCCCCCAAELSRAGWTPE